MGHQTRAFLAISMFGNVEGRCALLDLLSDGGWGYERLHHDFQLLDCKYLVQELKVVDQVFADFLTTNRHRKRCWTWEEMLRMTSSHPRKQFLYYSSSVPYTTTVWLFKGADTDVITMSLHNNGFAYVSKPDPCVTRQDSTRSYQSGWVDLPLENIRKQVSAIMAKVEPMYTKARAWHNFALQKMDLDFTVPHDASVPNVIIEFEKCSPPFEHQVKAHKM